jgi:hypothetical protein
MAHCIWRSSRRVVKRVALGATEEEDVEDSTARLQITWPQLVIISVPDYHITLVCPVITFHAGDNIM